MSAGRPKPRRTPAKITMQNATLEFMTCSTFPNGGFENFNGPIEL